MDYNMNNYNNKKYVAYFFSNSVEVVIYFESQLPLLTQPSMNCVLYFLAGG